MFPQRLHLVALLVQNILLTFVCNPLKYELLIIINYIKDIKVNKSEDKLKELKEVTNKFESIFINQILKQARNSKLAKGIFDSDAEKTFNSMIDQKYSEILSEKTNLGISEALFNQFKSHIDTGSRK